MRVPLTSNAACAATAAASRARAEADDARAQAEVDVVTAVQQVTTARARQAVGAAAVAQARESQRIIRDRFDAGLAPVTDVLRAASAVLDADALNLMAAEPALIDARRNPGVHRRGHVGPQADVLDHDPSREFGAQPRVQPRLVGDESDR